MGVQKSKKTNASYPKQKSFTNKSEKQNSILPETIKMVDIDIKYDSKTIDRIHSQHYLLKHVWESNFSSPIRSFMESGVMNALEVKCGPGTWILDMASEFPYCSFTGIDAIQTFPSEIKPKNTKFVLANQLEHLPFSTFSYIRIN